MTEIDRRTFIEMSKCVGLGILFGVGGPKVDAKAAKIQGRVVIIGAGAAGMTAALHLKKKGIPFIVLEASNRFGGRMKTARKFADFPIPLGAEWLHSSSGVLSRIAKSAVSVSTVGYKSSDTYVNVKGKKVSEAKLGWGRDRKFVNSSWLGFFQRYVLPQIRSDIRYGQRVTNIRHSNGGVTVTTQSGKRIETDKVIITVPLKMLQKGSIKFSPTLPAWKLAAIRSAEVWPGIKMFIEFSKNFYPTFTEFSDEPASAGHKLYYDAAYGHSSNRSVMGFFSVGNPSLPYIRGNAFGKAMRELDQIFDGQATRHYRKHVVQNWAREPYIHSAYLRDNESPRVVKSLARSLDDKIFFAGEAYTNGHDWGSVHAAAQAAISVVKKISR